MHPLLAKIIQKRGIKDVTELTSEERQQFDAWRVTLSEGEITVESIARDCEIQISVIEGEMKNLDNSTRKNDRLITALSYCKLFLSRVRGGQTEKENLEKYLDQMLSQS